MRALLAALAVLALSAPAAQAGIWTAVPSGTTDEISALDYPSTSRIVFATTTGKIFEGAPGSTAQVASFPGRQFFDLALNPAGTTGLAAADSGKLYRLSGGTWSAVNLANTTYNSNCDGSAHAKDKAPTANLVGVAWSSDSVAWVTSAETGQILKSTDGGASWTEASQQADGTCRISRKITDIGPIPGSVDDVYFADNYFGGLWRTSDGLASTAQRRKEFVNCYDILFRMAVDPAAPNRVVIAGACESYLHEGFTSDSGTTADYTDSTGGNIRDVASTDGLFLSVGDAGKIEQTFDGKNVYQQPADGANATKDWRAASFADTTHAAVGGVTGALVVTDQANTAPDVLAPTVQLTGPDNATVGTPVTFTAVATDNAGGSGIRGDGFEWTGTGLQPTTAGTATYSFATAGTYTLTVKARDNAGNVSEVASKTVTVGQPLPTLPSSSNPPITGGGATRKGKYIVLRVKGRLGVPAGVDKAAACQGTMSISVYKGKKRLVGKTTKVKSNCGYKKTIRVKRKKVGKAKKLKLKVAFRGNSVLGKLSSTYKVKVKR